MFKTNEMIVVTPCIKAKHCYARELLGCRMALSISKSKISYSHKSRDEKGDCGGGLCK
jgi:hypothetical protein